MAGIADLQAYLKENYSQKKVENLTYVDNPLVAMLPKGENWQGDVMPVVVQYGSPQGGSADFDRAQANRGASKGARFNLERTRYYQSVLIDNEAIEASMGQGSFVDTKTSEVDGAYRDVMRAASIGVYGSVGARRGQLSLSTNVTTTTGSLADKAQVENFEVGMVCQFAANTAGTSLRNSGGRLTISNIDRDEGKLYFSAAIDSNTGTVAGDYIYRDGDAGSGMVGLESWIPMLETDVGTLLGVDRTLDKTRLGGQRYDGSNKSISEALASGLAIAGGRGARTTHCFMNFQQWGQLANDLGSKAVLNPQLDKIGSVSFAGFVIHGPKGPVKVYADITCPGDRAYLLQLDTFKLHSLGKVPRTIGKLNDGQVTAASDDALEYRVGWYANLGCTAPGLNMVVKLQPVT